MRVAVGAITRRRPGMFGELLRSLVAMRRPEGVELLFLFAENDDVHTVEETVEAFRQQVPEEVRLELEPRHGIPMGRNRVLDMALAAGADYLTFVDDDETVAEDWLETLIAGMVARKLDLAGAPVELVAPGEEMTVWNQAVLAHLQDRSNRRNRERRKLAERGADSGLNIYTNNWCCRLEAQRRFDVRFDETLQFTGGSDTRFSLEMSRAGARVGWIPEARVFEPTPLKRLTVPYHFARARDQATNGVRLNQPPVWRSLRLAALRFLDALLLLFTLPVKGRYSLVKSAHKCGSAVGILRGVLGAQSAHYQSEAEGFHSEKGPTDL